jgi:uncharacterized protein (TIGR02996 family)
MNPIERQFRLAIAADPLDQVRYMAFADWLDEQSRSQEATAMRNGAEAAIGQEIEQRRQAAVQADAAAYAAGDAMSARYNAATASPAAAAAPVAVTQPFQWTIGPANQSFGQQPARTSFPGQPLDQLPPLRQSFPTQNSQPQRRSGFPPLANQVGTQMFG